MTEQQPKKILVVDDEPDVTDLLAYTLKAKGFAVEAVNNPNASIGLARSLVPDLVILDVMMPELNGIQICRMLRADQQGTGQAHPAGGKAALDQHRQHLQGTGFDGTPRTLPHE